MHAMAASTPITAARFTRMSQTSMRDMGGSRKAGRILAFSIMADMDARPLAGLRVLELGALIAGPFCAKLLGEFGAEVIKIEPPGEGDPLRKWRGMKDGVSLWWHVQSRGKQS